MRSVIQRWWKVIDWFAPSSRSRAAWIGALAVWVITMLSTPILLRQFGEELFPAISTLTVLIHLAASLFALSLGVSGRSLVGITLFSAVFTYAVELIGSKTGFPFGSYHYTEALQPQFLDVPLLIPLAWLMMLPAAWGVTALIAHKNTPTWLFAGLAGLVFTAWDLYLDPQMVSKGLWVWHEPNGYFGIPWVNYLGWWACATLITAALRGLGWLKIDSPGLEASRRALLLIYSITWLFQAFALGVFWGQPGPALSGLAGMGIFALWAWRRALHR